MAFSSRFVAQVSSSKRITSIFLRPVLRIFHSTSGNIPTSRQSDLSAQKRHFQLERATASPQSSSSASQLLALPRTCPGCGAFTQTTAPNDAGFYSINRKSVNAFLTQLEQGVKEGCGMTKRSKSSTHTNQPLSRDLGIDTVLNLPKGVLCLLRYLRIF